MPSPAATEAGRSGTTPAGLAVSPPIHWIFLLCNHVSKDRLRLASTPSGILANDNSKPFAYRFCSDTGNL